MRRFLFGVLLAIACALPACKPAWDGTTTQVEVHFSPRGGCTDAIAREIEAARDSIRVQAYSFTSAPIAKALVNAHKRGVEVQVILDKSQRTEKYSSADFLAHAGIPTYIDAEHAIAHNKIMILDGQVVITGSFNFTKAAEEHNAENLVVIRDPAVAARYTANWKAHQAHSEEYGGQVEAQSRSARPNADSLTADSADEYVSSANSSVFHHRGCRSAAKIAEKNIMTFATRGDAISSGRHPCNECKP